MKGVCMAKVKKNVSVGQELIAALQELADGLKSGKMKWTVRTYTLRPAKKAGGGKR